MIVIPGDSSDFTCATELAGEGAKKIRNFVSTGGFTINSYLIVILMKLSGRYIGIGSGAYFGGSEIHFDIGNNLVKERRDLAFFPGIIKGGSHAAKGTISFNNGNSYLLFRCFRQIQRFLC